MKAGCPPESILNRLWLEDLEEGDKVEVARHVEQCESCQAAIAEFERERQEFLVKNPPEKIEEYVLSQVERRIRAKRRFTIAAVPIAAIVLAVLFVVFWPVHNPKPTIRTKGGVSIELWVQDGEKVVKVGPGKSFKAGDRIQFKCTSGADDHVFLVSLDEAGQVSNFNHEMFGTSKKIVPGSGIVLEGSIILDESVQAERVFAIFSNEPIEWQEVELAAKQAHEELARNEGSLRELTSLPVEYPQATVLLRKRK